MTILKRFPLELFIWLLAFIVLYNLDLENKEALSICPIHRAGFDWCPGCGLGRSIGLLMHGEVKASMQMHWLGIPTVLVLLHRIVILFLAYINQIKHIK